MTMPLGSCTRRGSCGLNWRNGGIGTFCQEVAGPAEGVAAGCGTLGGMGFLAWATALIAIVFISKPVMRKSNNFVLFISALLWPVRVTALLTLQFPCWQLCGFLRGKFYSRRGEYQ